MKLNCKDKAILVRFGYYDEDMAQIEEAMDTARYSLCTTECDEGIDKSYDFIKEISASTARELLGDEEFLIGICSIADGESDMREVTDTIAVSFFNWSC